MGTTVREPEGTLFPLAPEGIYRAVCADVWDIWTEKRPEQWGGGLIDKTRIVWQLDAQDEENGKPYEVSMLYTASLHEKAKLRHHLESWRGRKFDKKELQGFILEEKLINACCQLQVIHHTGNNGKTYANVAAIMPLAKGMEKLKVSPDFVRKKNRAPKPDNGQPEEESYPYPEEESVPF